MNFEPQYLELLKQIDAHGNMREDRTGVGTKGVFGCQIRHDLAEGFPLLTTKKVHFKSVVGELLWFLSGCKGGIEGLRNDYGVTIWDEWKYLEEQGKVLPYTNMVRWGRDDINQLQEIIIEIKDNPYSRRLVVSNWNPKQVHYYKNLVIPACHTFFQFSVFDNKLSCQLYCRSQDLFLGTPFNVASYALLIHMVAQVCDLQVGDFIWTAGDAHIYNNHSEQVREQVSRVPYQLPTLRLNSEVKNIFDFKYEDIALENYTHHPLIKAPVAV